MAKPTTELSAQDRVILFCAATGIDLGLIFRQGEPLPRWGFRYARLITASALQFHRLDALWIG
jgi:hypothetical protein